MIPLAIPNISANEGKYLQECVETNFVSSVGKFVDQFENHLKVATGSEYAVATNSGTAAIHLALSVIGVTHGDLVILPSYTFIASANAISHTGASPLLVDVDESSWTISVHSLGTMLENETSLIDNILIHTPSNRPIKAIMPVFTLGIPADMDPINELAQKYNLPVIIDAAAALGTTYKGRPLSELAEMATISFNGNKIITSGGGGMIIGNNQEIMQKAKHLSTTARVGTDYHHDQIGFNYRLTNIQAAVGCAQIEVLDSFLTAKKKIYMKYIDAFKDHQLLETFPVVAWGESSHWFAGVILKKENDQLNVKKIIKELESAGIQARPFWKPVHLQPPYKDLPRTNMNICENLWGRVITLPCSTSLTDDEQEKVITSLNNILDGHQL